MIVGFTTGRLENESSFTEKMKFFADLGCQAIEFSLLDYSRFELIKSHVKHTLIGFFAHRSIHAPVKSGDEPVTYRDDEPTHALLRNLKWLCEAMRVAVLVVHPDRVEDWNVFKKYKLPICLENMDARKKTARTVADMGKFLEGNDYGMVLDVNHCFTNDPTMQLSHDLHSSFGQRIREVHLSGFIEPEESAKRHAPICETRQEPILRAAKDLAAPIILEGVCKTPEQFKKEFAFVTEYCT